MKLSLVVGFRGDGGHRSRAWEWCSDYWSRVLPEAEQVVRDAGGERFHRAASINLAARESSGDVLVLADADSFVDVSLIRKAAEMRVPVIPYAEVCRLTEEWSERVYEGTRPRPAFGTRVNGVVPILTLTPDQFFRAGGFDERFHGWGGEDNAFKYALSAIVQPLTQLDHGVMYHLWHPRAPKKSPGNRELFQRYRAARGDRDALSRLVHGP